MFLVRNKHTRQSDPNEFRTKHGDRYHVLYGSKVNPDKTITLYEVSREDIKAKINSHAVETDMALILNRLKAGDTSVLTSKKPIYADFTQFPKTYAEAFDLVKRSTDAFDSLPTDVKLHFDNDVSEWFGSIGSPAWLSAMGLDSNTESSVEPVAGGDSNE